MGTEVRPEARLKSLFMGFKSHIEQMPSAHTQRASDQEEVPEVRPRSVHQQCRRNTPDGEVGYIEYGKRIVGKNEIRTALCI